MSTSTMRIFVTFLGILTWSHVGLSGSAPDALRAPRVRETLKLTLNFQFEEAIERAEAMIAEAPNDPVPRLLKSEALWWMHINRRDSEAVRAALLTTSRECVALAGKRLRANPRDRTGLFAAGCAHARIAAVHGIEEKKWSAVREAMKARRLLLRLSRVAPDFCDLYAPLGLYEYYAGRQATATRLVSGAMYGLFGSRDKGIAYLRRALDCGDYFRAEAGFYLALFYLHWEDSPEEAIPILEGLTGDYPENLSFKGMLAYANGKVGRHERAVALYGEILETARKRDLFGPEGYGTTRFFLAEFLHRMGRYEEAAAELDEILRLEIENAEWLIAHTHLARARADIELGKPGRARQALTKVLSLKNHTDSHRQARDLLRTLSCAAPSRSRGSSR